MIVHKVASLAVEPDTFRSMCYWQPTSVRYRLGINTVPYPGCGPLTAFECIGDALSFINGSKQLVKDNFVVLEAEAERSSSESIWFPNHVMFFAEWQVRYEIYISDLPMGTILCDNIRPIRVEGYILSGIFLTPEDIMKDFKCTIHPDSKRKLNL